MPNKHSQGYFTGADTFLHVDPFLQTNFMTPHVFLWAPEKWPWPCSFRLKFNTHVSHIYLRLNVEAFSSNRLDGRDKWRFHNVCKFPFSCSPSCHPFWRNCSVLISSGEYIQSAVNFKLYTLPRQFSFTYKWTFLFDMIRVHDILVDGILKWINVTCFAILDVNLTPLNSRGNRKTTWNLDVLEFLVLKKLLHTYSKWQNMINFRLLRYRRQRICSWPLVSREAWWAQREKTSLGADNSYQHTACFNQL